MKHPAEQFHLHLNSIFYWILSPFTLDLQIHLPLQGQKNSCFCASCQRRFFLSTDVVKMWMKECLWRNVVIAVSGNLAEKLFLPASMQKEVLFLSMQLLIEFFNQYYLKLFSKTEKKLKSEHLTRNKWNKNLFF